MTMYRVTVYATPMPIPIQFLLHTWLVVEHAGTVHRFDVFGFQEDGRGVRCGYVYKNFSPPTQGAPLFAIGKHRFLAHKTWAARVLYVIEGDQCSDAHRIYELLNHGICKVPSIQRYNIALGPNSNSFTQWVLDAVAPGKYPLPFNAYGKSFVW